MGCLWLRQLWGGTAIGYVEQLVGGLPLDYSVAGLALVLER